MVRTATNMEPIDSLMLIAPLQGTTDISSPIGNKYINFLRWL
jgi:hypothetical protein